MFAGIVLLLAAQLWRHPSIATIGVLDARIANRPDHNLPHQSYSIMAVLKSSTLAATANRLSFTTSREPCEACWGMAFKTGGNGMAVIMRIVNTNKRNSNGSNDSSDSNHSNSNNSLSNKNK